MSEKCIPYVLVIVPQAMNHPYHGMSAAVHLLIAGCALCLVAIVYAHTTMHKHDMQGSSSRATTVEGNQVATHTAHTDSVVLLNAEVMLCTMGEATAKSRTHRSHILKQQMLR